MQSRYIAALTAGIVGGVLLAGYLAVSFILELIAWNAWVPGIGAASGACGCLTLPAILVISLATGAMAVMRAKDLTKLTDAAIVSALSGALAGLIYGVVNVIIAFLRPVIEFGTSVDSSDIVGSIAVGSLFGGAGGVGTCLCAPIWLIIIAVVAAIGGAIYASVKLKLK
jgi:hypothetical protein